MCGISMQVVEAAACMLCVSPPRCQVLEHSRSSGRGTTGSDFCHGHRPTKASGSKVQTCPLVLRDQQMTDRGCSFYETKGILIHPQTAAVLHEYN